MNISNVFQIFSTSSSSPCASGEFEKEQGNCVGSGVEEWLEDKTLAGFRVWQLAGIIISILVTITVGLCCCIRFRIPRTKQEIEADWIRKKIVKGFRQELKKIPDKEMDEMDLKKALEKIRAGIEADKKTEEVLHKDQEVIFRKPQGEIRTRYNKMFHGTHTHFNQVPLEIDSVI